MAAAGEVLWTCPMHPQIIRKEPGSCPICGMALELMTPAAGDTASPELRDMTRRSVLRSRCRCSPLPWPSISTKRRLMR